MSDTELDVTPKDDSKKTFESEVINLIVEHSATAVASIADVVALAVAAGLPDLVCKETGQTTPATDADLCAVKVLRVPCNGTYVNAAGDKVTLTDETLDYSLCVNSLSINNSGDDDFAGVDTAGEVLPGADAVSAWCLQFERSLTAAEIAAL